LMASPPGRSARLPALLTAGEGAATLPS